ncbi:MAG TPA: hypothetical protein VNZ47_11060 [Candidatus Dormibacteraeota bacterium]|jgi:hypothetical protein|nr:hypothetical protein [Candidatus Dormibacteraeota bacterium]
MIRNSKRFTFACGLMVAALVAPAPSAFARDDFGKIVHHIEANYHVHRQHRFVMGLAGFTVKFWHIAGVKSLKGAIFENQRFTRAASDTRFDEVVRAAMDSGWQPLVQSWDRHTGERTYIYAQDVSSKKGKDVKVLVVTLESNEAIVLQVKVDPRRLDEFIEETGPGGHRRNQPAPREETQPRNEERVEVAASTLQSWDGICLFLREDSQAGVQP